MSFHVLATQITHTHSHSTPFHAEKRTRLRTTRTAHLDSTSETSSHDAFLGFDGDDFGFEQLQNAVVFSEVSLYAGGTVESTEKALGVDAVEKWIADLRR